MPLKKISLTTLGTLAFGLVALQAGPYSGAQDTTHAIDPAIPSGSTDLIGWAASVIDFSPSPAGTSGNEGNALGSYNTSLVSLGDLTATEIANNVAPGSITLGFGGGLSDGSGWDFAVFENGFTGSGGLFAEFAYVEVSSNGTDFARFDSISTNTESLGGFGPGFEYWDTTNVYNLAGKHAGGYGTPFDLSELATDPLVINGDVDLASIGYIRLVDIPGDGSFEDSVGNSILDNWPSTGSTGGLDLRAVGYRYDAAVPEPAETAVAVGLLALGVTWLRRRRR